MSDYDEIEVSVSGVKTWLYGALGKFVTILLVLLVVGLVLAGLARAMFFNFIDQHEVGYRYDRLSGEVTTLDRTGYHFSWPFIVNIGAIDARPVQVCIAGKVNRVKERVLNCKLVRFDKRGMKTFIEWHSRDFGDLDEILKAYAYSGQKEEYPFLEILSEIGSESPTKPSKPDTNVQATKQPVQAVNDDGGTQSSEDYFQLEQ